MKRRYVAMLLTAAMVLGSFAGCGSTGTADNGKEAQNETDKTTDNTADGETVSSGAHGPSSEAAPDWTAYDERIAAIGKETDLVKREALMHEAEDELMSTWGIIPLYYYNDTYMQKTDVDGIYANRFAYKYFGYATAPGNKLDLNIASEPDSLDPALNTTVDGASLVFLTFVGLYTYNEEGQLVPDLATGYEMNEDGTQYTFTLREGAKWSDGETLDAADLVYSWNRFADPNTGSDFNYLADVIAKKEDGTLDIEASEDGLTFTVNLAAPCVYFIDLCAFPAFFPVPEQNVTAAKGAESNPGAWCTEAGYVTSGPFSCESWKHNESMTFVKNPNYYDTDRVSLEKLNFMLSEDDIAVYNAFQDGSLQFIDSIPTDEMKKAKETPEYHNVEMIGTYYVGFNVNSDLFKGKTVEQAAKMRQAFSLLIDRQYIVDAIGQANQEVANTFIPTGMGNGNGGIFRENDADYTYPDEENVGYFDPTEVNVEKAIELLKEAGYEFDEAGMLSESTPIHLTYLTNDSEGHVKVGESLQQDFGAIGITLDVETREWAVFLAERKNGNFDFAREGWTADYNDPINMLEMWSSKSGNNDMQFGK